MYTPASLLEIALDLQTQIDASPNEVRWNLAHRREEALNTAIWMEQHGITEAASIGPFGNLPIKQGAKVRVRKGAKITGTGNNVPEQAGATHPVTVRSIDSGACFVDYDDNIVVRNQTVHWAGRGGYWRWTDASNVVAEPSPKANEAVA